MLPFMWKTLRAIWQALNAVSTLTWLWGLPWAAGLAVVVGLWAQAEHQPPVVIAVLVFAAFVLAYVLYVALQVNRLRSTGTDFHNLKGLAVAPTPQSGPTVTNSLVEEYDRLSQQTLADARVRKAAVLAPNLFDSGPRRDVYLADALGWAAYGKWGQPFHGAPFTISLSGSPRIEQLLERVCDLAEGGKLTLWGIRDDPGYYEEIPKLHWEENPLVLADVFGTVISGEENPYRKLMLNRAQVEEAWPHAG
jgi:hypothetical protein